MFPIVGQQVTAVAGQVSSASAREALLEAMATAGECDLVAHGRIGQRDVGFVFTNGAFQSDVASAAPVSSASLLAQVGKGGLDALTFSAVPPGSGWRIGVDRDGDGYANGDELAAGSDPANPNSTP
jgi:hypothetical protein